MIENLIDDGASVLDSSSPIGWSCFVLGLDKRVSIFFFVVICDLSGAPRGEADFGLRWGQAAFGNEQLALTLLLAGDVSTGTDVCIRLRLRVGRAIDWCWLL
jgi:hypothetical protein